MRLDDADTEAGLGCRVVVSPAASADAAEPRNSLPLMGDLYSHNLLTLIKWMISSRLNSLYLPWGNIPNMSWYFSS